MNDLSLIPNNLQIAYNKNDNTHFRAFAGMEMSMASFALHWRHNDHDGVSNHQPHDCLRNRLFWRRSKKTSKLHVTGLCVGNSPGPVNSPHKGPVTRKMFPFDDVIMWELATIPLIWILWINGWTIPQAAPQTHVRDVCVIRSDMEIISCDLASLCFFENSHRKGSPGFLEHARGCYNARYASETDL